MRTKQSPTKPQLSYIQTGERATEAQIAEWKELYGEVFELTDATAPDPISDELEYELDDPGYDESARYVYVKRPTRQVISLAQRAMEAQGRDGLRFIEVVLKNVWITGHRDFIENDGLLLSVGEQIQEIIGMRTLALKKL